MVKIGQDRPPNVPETLALSLALSPPLLSHSHILLLSHPFTLRLLFEARNQKKEAKEMAVFEAMKRRGETTEDAAKLASQ